MKNFTWKLNWRVQDIFVESGSNIMVLNNGKIIGKCKLIVNGNDIIGEFHLDEELEDDKYILYLIGMPEPGDQRFLSGISFVNYYEGLEKRARLVSEMKPIH